MKAKQKKILSGMVAICCAAALLVTGTFAWQAIASAINPFSDTQSGNEDPKDNNPGGNLHDDFDHNTGAKNIYVENTGNADIYIRVKLQEVFVNGSSEKPEELDWKTHIPAGDDPAKGTAGYHAVYAKEDAVNPGFVWTMGSKKDYPYQSITGSSSWQPIEEDAAQAEIEEARKKNDNLIGDALGSATDHSGTVVKLGEVTGHDKTAPKCEVITMAVYNKKNAAEKAAFAGWVYDTDGYAYWSQPLAKGGTTGLLLGGVKLPAKNSQTYYYAINAELEYVDIVDLPAWTDDEDLTNGGKTPSKPSDDAKDMLDEMSKKLKASPSEVAVEVGRSIEGPEITDAKGNKVEPSTLTWTSADSSKVKVDAKTGTITGVAKTSEPVVITGTNEYGKTVEIYVTVTSQGETESESESETGSESESETSSTDKDLTAEDPVTDLNVGDKEEAPVVKDEDGNEVEIIEWESSDPDVVSVDPDTGEITAEKPGEATITGKDKDGNEVTYPVTVTDQLTPADAAVSVKKGESKPLPGITNAKGESLDPKTLTWTSADSSKVNVDGNAGTITGVAITDQPVKITGTDSKGNKVEIEVTVTAPDAKDLTAEDPANDLNVGDKADAPTVTDEDGNEVTIIDWESSDPDVVSVDPDTGEITGEKPGNATITGTDEDGNEVTYPVTVKDSLAAEPSSIAMEAETSHALPTITNAKGESVDAASLTWASADGAKVKVEAGKIVAIAVTDTPVKLTGTDANGNKAEVSVTVTAPERALKVLDPPTAMTVGDEANAPKVIVTGDTTETPVTIGSWTSSNKDAVTVDPVTGKIKAVGKGSAAITGKDTYGNEVSYTVNSDWKELTAEDADPMNVGDKKTAPVVKDKDGNPVTITEWESGDNKVVTVDPKTGELTATGKGTTTITGKDKDGNPVGYTVTVTDELSAASERVTVKVDESASIPEIRNAKGEVVSASDLSWTISDNTKVKIDKVTGMITGLEVAADDVILTGTDTNGNKVEIKVTVIAPDAKKLVTESPDTMNIGESASAPLVIVDGDKDKTPVAIVKWISSDTSVVTVDASGTITAKGKGTAVITGEDKYGNEVRYDVEVTDELTASPNKVTVASGKNTAIPAIKDASGDTVNTSNLTWTSADGTKVKVEDSKIVGVKATEDGKPVKITGTDKDNNKVEIEVTVTASAEDKLRDALDPDIIKDGYTADPNSEAETCAIADDQNSPNYSIIPYFVETDPLNGSQDFWESPDDNYGIIALSKFINNASEHAANVTFTSDHAYVQRIEGANLYLWYLPTHREYIVDELYGDGCHPEATITATYTDPDTKETASMELTVRISYMGTIAYKPGQYQ